MTMAEILNGISDVSGALWDAAGDAAGFVIETPLAMIAVFVGLTVIGVNLASRFLFAH